MPLGQSSATVFVVESKGWLKKNGRANWMRDRSTSLPAGGMPKD
jgi:hypothetical protein